MLSFSPYIAFLEVFYRQEINQLLYHNLQKYGLKVYLRNPNSYTPLIKPGGLDGKARSLTIGRDSAENARQIAQFSTKDAEVILSLLFEQLVLLEP